MERKSWEGGTGIPVATVGAKKTYKVRVQTQRDGHVVATCDSPPCMARASSEADALARLRDEIRYREEWCPCTGVDDDYVQLEVVAGTRTPGR
jgi:hypothetical protein